MGQFVESILGRGGVNQNGFSSFLLGKNRLRNKDKDAVPDLFDCSSNNYWKDAPIIPAQLQALRPRQVQTLSEYQISKSPQQAQQQGLSQTQIDEITQTQKSMDGLSYEDYFSKYQNLPDYMKEYFTNPSEIKQTSEYQTYETQKNLYEQQKAKVEAWNLARAYYISGLPPQRQMGLAAEYLREFYTRGSYALEKMREETAKLGQQVSTVEFSRQGGIGGNIYITEEGQTRLANAQDYSKYGTTRENVIRGTPGVLQASTETYSPLLKYKFTQDIQRNIEKVQDFGKRTEPVTSFIDKTFINPQYTPLEQQTPTQQFIKGKIKEVTENPLFRTFVSGQALVDLARSRGSNLILGEVDISGVGSYDDVGEVLSSSRFGKRKKQQLMSELGEGKYSSLGEDLQKEYAQETLSTIERDLLNKETLKEQLEYLNTIRTGLKTEKAKINFDKYVKSDLLERGIIKPIVTIKAGGEVVSNLPSSSNVINLMKGSSVVAFLGLPTSQTTNAFEGKTGVMTATSGFSDNPLFSMGERTQQQTTQKERVSQQSADSLLFGQSQPQQQKERQQQKEQQISASSLLFGQPQRQTQPQIEQYRTEQRTRQEYKQTQPQTYKQKTPMGFGFIFEKEREKQEPTLGYNAFARIDSTKKTKAHWKKLNKKPLTKNTALGIMGQFVDENISAKGQIKPVKVNPNEISKQRNDYFNANRYKFREWRQSGGVRQKTPMTFLELENYRADSPKEVQALKTGKRQAQVSNLLFGGSTGSTQKNKNRGRFRL